MKKVFLSSLALFCAVLPASEEIAIRFEDIAQKSGLLFTSDSSPTPNKNQPETMVGGVALVDYDNDGYLDVYFVNGAGIPSLKKESPKYWNRLYHNNRNGTFTDVSAQMGIDKFYGKGMGVVFADYDHDGFMDVFVANDNAPNQLFHNLGGKSFEEVALQAGVAYPEPGAFISGMGADFKDIDNDGYEDLWHTAIEGESFPLFRNSGKGDFTEITDLSGLGRATRQM